MSDKSGLDLLLDVPAQSENNPPSSDTYNNLKALSRLDTIKRHLGITDAPDKSKPYIPLNSSADDGWSKEKEATATCYCGDVQLAFPTEKPGMIGTFVCNCTDCRKITASMFASNFIVKDAYLRHLRGQDKLKQFGQSRTIATGHTMTNHFCSTCGTLMYRVGSAFPGHSILRIGTVDDFHLHETKLRPRVEQFTKDRVAWLQPVEGAKQVKAGHYK